eukprot:EG_transcript_6684
MSLVVQKLSEFATLPTCGSAYAACYDLSSAHDVIVPARGKAIVPTDLAVTCPEGMHPWIAPHSRLAAKHHIDIGNGMVHYDFRGNVGFVVFNLGEKDFEVKRGDRIAQLILIKPECITAGPPAPMRFTKEMQEAKLAGIDAETLAILNQEVELMGEHSAQLKKELVHQQNKEEEEAKNLLEAPLGEWKQYAEHLLKQRSWLASEFQQKVEAARVQKERIKHLEDCVASMKANQKQLQDENALLRGELMLRQKKEEEEVEAARVQTTRIKHLEDCVASMDANRKQLQDENALLRGELMLRQKKEEEEEVEAARVQTTRIKHLEDCVASMDANRKQFQEENALLREELMRQQKKEEENALLREELMRQQKKEEENALLREELMRQQKKEEERAEPCVVCCTETAIPTDRIAVDCRHHRTVCAGCVRQYINVELRDKGRVANIPCPMVGECDAILQYNDLQRQASPEDFEMYDQLLTKQRLEAMPEFLPCATAGCDNGQLYYGNRSTPVTCHHCRRQTSFIHRCLVPGQTCGRCYANSRQSEAALQQTMQRTGIKQCPRCRTGIQKNDGCDHMTCRCGHEFCWECLTDYGAIQRQGNAAHARTCRHHG